MGFVSEPDGERRAVPRSRRPAVDAGAAHSGCEQAGHSGCEQAGHSGRERPASAVRPVSRLSAGAAVGLQRLAGNRAVSRLVAQRRAASGTGKSAGSTVSKPGSAGGKSPPTGGTVTSAPGGEDRTVTPTAEPFVQRLADGRAGARSGPGSDPKFTALKRDVRSKQQTLGKHPPAKTEANAAQGAAKAPPDDKEAQGKTANAEKMN
ncbi:MAG: hypothetical protein ACRDUV_19360, partial [Pseudonocardiaceae bacterium]